MMKTVRLAALVLVSLFAMFAAASSAAEPAVPKIRLAVVTGGHPFNEAEFFKLFEGYDDIAWEHRPQATGGELFDNIDGWPYDAILLYNFAQQIVPAQQENFVKLLDRGVGLFVLHHANDAYPNWPLYAEITGVQSHFGPWEKDGQPMAPSDFSRGLVTFTVHVADAEHPITRGLADYQCADETYCRRSFGPDIHPLLTTEEPSSDPLIAWVKTFRKARVLYLQSGHDEKTYQNPTYRTLIARGIRWTAGRLP